MKPVICPYCNKPAELVTGREVYPHRRDLWKKKFYVCLYCNARVGCHPGTSKPLGVPASAELRKARMAAHRVFDPLWRPRHAGYGRVFKSRSEAYRWLADCLGIKAKRCHIGQFDEQQCEKTVAACREVVEQKAR